MLTRIVFVALTMLSCGFASAQDEKPANYFAKGQWFGNGTISFSTFPGFENPAFTAHATTGCFVGYSVAIGLNFSHSFLNQSKEGSFGFSGYEASFSSSLLNPFVRGYFMNKRFAPFLEAGFGAIWSTSKRNQDSHDTRTQFYTGGLGFNYFATPAVALEWKITYSYRPDDVETWYDDEEDAALAMRFSLQFLISKNQNNTLNENKFFEKGTWMLSGRIDFGDKLDVSYFGYTETDQVISPEAVYFLTDRVALGLGVQFFKMEYASYFNFNPLVRYYFSSKGIAPFIDGSFGFGHYNREHWGETKDARTFPLQVGAGIDYFINDFVALETKLSCGVFGFERPVLTAETGLKFMLTYR